jgi:hypothetical protein
MAAYQQQRDAETMPLYTFTLALLQSQDAAPQKAGWDARLVLTDVVQGLIERNPDLASAYIGIFSGATRVPEFFHPLNLARAVALDAARQTADRVGALLRSAAPQTP